MTRPQFIVVSGIDGSGKTTIIEALKEEFEKRGQSTCYIWLRYNHIIIKPFHAVCRLVGLSRKRHDGSGNIVWRHEFYRCRSFCHLYIALTYLDSLLSQLKTYQRVNGTAFDIVLCDRWIYDILIDLAVDTRRPSLLCNRWMSRFEAIMPKDAKQYLIKRNKECILAIRPEYQGDREFAFRHRMYKRLERLPRVTTVHNDRTIQNAVDIILKDWEKIQYGNLVFA